MITLPLTALTPKSIGGADLILDEADGHLKLVYANGVIVDLVQLSSNVLVNGGFDYAQRQVPGTLTTYSQTASRIYGPDRWFIGNSVASTQYQRVDTASGLEAGYSAQYYGKFKKLTSTGKMLTGQVIPASVTSGLQGTTVRLQCKLKRDASASLTVRVALAQLTAAGTIDTVPGYVAGAPSGTFVSAWGAAGVDPTLGTNMAFLAPTTGTQEGGVLNSTGLTAVLGTTWARYGAAYLIPADAKNLVVLVYTDSIPVANQELNIGEAGVYPGSAVQPFWEVPDPAVELARCQRFYIKSFNTNTAPAQNAGSANSVQGIAGKTGAVALAGNIPIRFPFTMRAAPTVTLYCPTEASAQVDRLTGTTPIAHTASAQADLGDSGLMVTSTGTTNTAIGDVIAVHYAADAEI